MISLDQTSEILFGESEQLVDWLYEAAFMLPTALFEIEPRLLVRFQAERLSRLRGPMIDQFEHAATQCMSRPQGFRSELEAVRSGVMCTNEIVHIARPDGLNKRGGDRAVRETLWNALEIYLAELELEKTEFQAALQWEYLNLDPITREKLGEADRLVRDAMREDAGERATLLREARRAYQAIVAEPLSITTPSLWTRYAWLGYRLSTNLDEPLNVLESSLRQASMVGKPGFDFACRQLAYLLSRAGRFEDAFAWVSKSCEIRPSSSAYHERASYASATNKFDWAKPAIEALAESGPIGILLGFADPKIATFSSTLLDATVKQQMKWRKEASQNVAAWQAFAKKTLDARRLLGQLSLPRDLVEEAQNANTDTTDLDFMRSKQLSRQAKANLEDLRALTLGALQGESRRRADALKAAKNAVNAAQQRRERIVQSALQERQSAVQTAKGSLEEADSQDAMARTVCAWGFGSGFTIFAFYIFVGGFMTMRGMDAGLNTTFGSVTLGLSAIPIVVAIVMHIVYSCQRMRVDARVGQEIAAATESYARIAQAAEEKYKSEIYGLRERQMAEEEQLKRVEEALQLVS